MSNPPVVTPGSGGNIADNSILFNQVNVTGTFNFTYDTAGMTGVAIAVTCTPVSSGTGTLALSGSNDGVNFATIPNTQVSITQAGTTILSVQNPTYRYIQVNYAATSNGMTLVGTVSARN